MPMNSRDLEQTIQNAFDGELSESDADALRDALRNSPGAIDMYCEHAMLESELRRHAVSRGKIPGAIPYRARLAATLRQRRQVGMAAMAAAAVLLLAGLVLHLVWFSPEMPLARLEVSSGSSLSDADGRVFQAGDLRRNETVVLGQGVARFEFDSGVVAVIDGPAAIKLTAADRMELTGGHAWVRVPAGARGFRVESARLEVIDLGTEFGLDLREDVSPQVHVFVGEVEVVSRIGNRSRTRLKAGGAGIQEPSGNWKPGRADPGKFRSRLPEALPLLKMDFDTLVDGRLEIGGNAVGVPGSSAWVIEPDRAKLVPGVAGKALQLTGDGAHVETTWPGISGSAPRTFSLWCMVPSDARFSTAPPLAWWGNPGGVNRKFKVALRTGAREITALRTSFGQTLYDGCTDLADGRWHHLAVVYRGNLPDGKPDLDVYVDGRLEPLAETGADAGGIETETGTDATGNFGLGKYELPSTGRNPFLCATLDELRIYAGALSDAEIRAEAEKSPRARNSR